MKIAKKKNEDLIHSSLKPAIPFTRGPGKKLERGEYHAYKLRTVPGDSNSPVYELSVPFFSAGTPEEWLKFMKNIQAVFVGQDVTTGPTQFAMAKALLKGDALSVFETSTLARGTMTVANFKSCLQDITTHVFPAKATQTQKGTCGVMLRSLQECPRMNSPLECRK